MRGRWTVNFLAKTLFACTAKVVSSVRDRCDGIPLASRAVPPARHVHAAKWFLAPLHFFTFIFLDPAIKFDSAPNRFRVTWTALHPRGGVSDRGNSWKSDRLR
jgi:hypothetical protein